MNVDSVLRAPIVFFISRLLILTGMVLCFAAAAYFIGIALCVPLFGVNAFANPSVLLSYESEPAVLNALKFLQAIVSIGVFVVPALVFPKAIQQKPVEFLRLRSGLTPTHLVFGVALMLASMPLVSWLVYFNEHITFPSSMADFEQKLKAMEQAAQELTRAFTKADSFSGFLVNIVLIALLPALCEELFFRGALQQFVHFTFRNGHLAVWLTAVIFSAFHQEFYGFLPRTLLGALLGYLFLYTGSLWVSVIAHFLNNALALSARYYQLDQQSIDFLKEDYVFPLYVNILSLLATAGIIYLMHFIQKKGILRDEQRLDKDIQHGQPD